MPSENLPCPNENNLNFHGNLPKFLSSISKQELDSAQKALACAVTSISAEIDRNEIRQGPPDEDELFELLMTCKRFGLNPKGNHALAHRDSASGQMCLYITNAGLFYALRRTFVERVDDIPVGAKNERRLAKLETALEKAIADFSDVLRDSSRRVASKYRAIMDLYRACGLRPLADHVVLRVVPSSHKVIACVTVEGLRYALRPKQF
ncbi:MAG: hypothetical protein LUC43_06700 [Burkholderiales bacterium]|nr:hypothetical protein [Burkholderiales bacterium]